MTYGLLATRETRISTEKTDSFNYTHNLLPRYLQHYSIVGSSFIFNFFKAPGEFLHYLCIRDIWMDQWILSAAQIPLGIHDVPEWPKAAIIPIIMPEIATFVRPLSRCCTRMAVASAGAA